MRNIYLLVAGLILSCGVAFANVNGAALQSSDGTAISASNPLAVTIVGGGVAIGGGWSTDSLTQTVTTYNVGIGSTSPQSALDVKGMITASNLQVTGASTFTGNVGIGTTIPRGRLDIDGGTIYGSALVLDNALYITGANAVISSANTWMLTPALTVNATLGVTTPFQVIGASTTHFEVFVQNTSSAPLATSDLTTQTNDGSQTSKFHNVGINNSGYTSAVYYGGPYDSYDIADAGTLTIMAQTAGKDVLVIAGGTTTAQEVIRFKSGGNVGIGTVSPIANLNISSSSTLATVPELEVDNSFYSSKVVVLNSGNVGIGSVAPVTRLNIQGNTATANIIGTQTRNLNASGNSVVLLQNDNTDTLSFAMTGTSYPAPRVAFLSTVGGAVELRFGTNQDASNGGTTPITFYVGGYNANQERLRIASSGNIGIGTQTVGARLDVCKTGNCVPRYPLVDPAVYVGSGGSLEVDGVVYADSFIYGQGSPGVNFNAVATCGCKTYKSGICVVLGTCT